MTTGWQEWTAADAAEWIAAPAPDDDKYSRGVLGVVTGSPDFPGAAVLGVEAAHRTGVGMVRYIGHRVPCRAVLDRRPETVTVPGRVQAWLIGSGIDQNRRSFVLLGDLTHALADHVPVVVDAGALDLVGTHTAPTLITPHAGELARMLTSREVPASVEDVRAAPGEWAQRAAAELGVAVLLKGAITHVCDPDGDRFTVTAPTHWLATAGSGDVLGGILGALVATHHVQLATDATALTSIAASASWVHGEAARRASAEVDGGPVTALDIAEAVPAVIGSLLAR
jgi:ADP-dependent NAD(P)H-hydrate dehydratase / NAD(P)H-hydrate epimerase